MTVSAGRAASDEFLALNRSNELVAHYPHVKRLLSAMADDELMRAGRLLARLDPDEIARAHPGTVSVKVFVTGHGTLAPMIPPLTAELARHGIVLRPRVSEFGRYLFDLSDPGSALYAYQADLTLCVLDPMIVLDEAPVPWRPPDIERILREKLDLIERLVTTFATAGRGTLVLNTIPLPAGFTAQLVDHRSRAQLSRIWHEASARLLRTADDHPGVVAVDLGPLLAEGIPATDDRLSAYAGAHLSPRLLQRYARDIAHLARQLAGLSKKVLVLDLDGTLWDGVLGDDGVEGIDAGEGPRGRAFRAFQRVVRQLGSQGVLLAVASKNDAGLVRQALRGHRHMLVTEEDFVQVAANWEPKHQNIARLADSLNLGLGSFVFADDSPYECELVRRGLPEVTVVQLDGDPAFNAGELLRDGWFDTLELTEADRARTAQYRGQAARAEFLQAAGTIDDYLAKLGLEVRLTRAEPSDVPRVSQLTLRTNQFNLTTRRLQPPDVRSLIAEPSWRVLVIRAKDRFGEHGLVGAIFTRRRGATVHIDNFLLSCRVFSRGIEQACLSAVLRQARADGVEQVSAEYRATARNGIVRDLYPQHGFATTSSDETGANFQHDLSAVLASPAHLTLVDDIQGLRI